MATNISFDIIARDKASKTFSTIAATSERTQSRLGKFTKAAAIGLGGLGTALGAVGLMGVKTAAANEQAQIAFTTMLGSAKKARSFLGELQKFAAKTPFEFPELQTAASSLISAGINAKKVIPIMTTLGDVTAGMGTGSEGIKRATIALQQMNAAGRITGEDLNQLRDAGIPVYDLLAKATGKTKAEVVALAQAGKLGHKELDQMMRALETGKGLERFSGLMDKQSHSLTGMVSTLKDTFGQGLAVAVTPMIPTIKRAIGGATAIVATGMPKIAALFRSIDLSGVAEKVQAAFGSLDLSAVGTNLSEQAKAWGAPIISGFELGLNTGDWSGLGKALGNGLVKAINGAGAVAGKILDGLDKLFAKVDWVGLGISIGKQAPSLVLGLVAGILNFDLMGLLKGVMRHWSDILLAVLAIAFTPGKIVGKVGELLARIPLIGKFLEWALNSTKGLADGFVSGVWKAMKFLGDAFVQGFRRVFPGAGAKFAGELAIFPIRLQLWALKLEEKGLKALLGLGKGIAKGAGVVFSKLGELVGRMVRPFADAGGWLISKGAALIGGLLRGLKTKWGDVAAWLLKLPGRILHGVGYLSTLLIDAGKAVISGFFTGLKAKWDDVAGWIGGRAKWIKDHKGPIDKDRILLKPAGVAIMEGLLSGLKSRQPALESVLNRLTAYITKQANKISDLMSKKSDAISSVKGFAQSVFGATFSDAEGNQKTPQVADLLNYQKQQLARARQVQHDVKALLAKGLSKSLIQQLVNAGDAGIDQLHALAAGSKGDIHTLNALDKATNAALGSAGTLAGNALYGRDIQTARANKAVAEAMAREFRRVLREERKGEETVVKIGPDAIIRVIRTYAKSKGVTAAQVLASG